jgi:hypothetical protein
MKLSDALRQKQAQDIYEHEVSLVGVVEPDSAAGRCRIYPVAGNRSVYVSVAVDDINAEVHEVNVAEASRRGFFEPVFRVLIRGTADVKVVSIKHKTARELVESPPTAQQTCGPYCCPNGFCVSCTGPNCSGGCNNGTDPWANCT